MADDLGASADSVGRWLRELIDAQLIVRKRRGPGRAAACEFVWHSALDSADLRNVDSAEVRNQQVLDSADLRNVDSAEVRNQQVLDSADLRNVDSAELGRKTPQDADQDSANMRSDIKEETVHLNGSLKRQPAPASSITRAVHRYFPRYGPQADRRHNCNGTASCTRRYGPGDCPGNRASQTTAPAQSRPVSQDDRGRDVKSRPLRPSSPPEARSEPMTQMNASPTRRTKRVHRCGCVATGDN